MSIHKKSRYQNTDAYIFEEDGVRVPTLKRRKLFQLPSEGDTITYKIVKGDTLDYLADEFLGDSSYYWVILDCNPELMAPWDIEPGDEITIPTYETLRRGLENYGL